MYTGVLSGRQRVDPKWTTRVHTRGGWTGYDGYDFLTFKVLFDLPLVLLVDRREVHLQRLQS